MISFASDNCASALPEVLASLSEANHGHMPAYGADPVTERAVALIRQSLNTEAPVYFVGTGTAANVLALKAMVLDYQSIIAPDTAHIMTHEVGAPAHLTGSMILTRPNTLGKITPDDIRALHRGETAWGRHSTEPKVVSISQPTEFGTVYTLEELAAIRATCDELSLYLHMDGCRLYNAAATLGCTLADLAGFADILCLGGTKAGLMFGEALVFINPQLADNFDRRQKLGLQLMSKMRYVSAQFEALFTNDLGLKAAHHANAMSLRLWEGLQQYGAKAAYPVESNQLFVTLPKQAIPHLQQAYPFYVYDQERGLVRLITSHDTHPEHVDSFLALLRKYA
ncbi:threonine aldolase family protein [Parendozoicomonas haliclonae]|uniref:Low specificity L-threonine aldolase n=1 Tax=Parendozoicomonas haliclonae TaxID=1960125 RepID=A0A1X7ARK0_9GAMM|nr:beta-eliminating lyase-related protein [Parendozoicomonas haliclonae]SMA50773.1 Low specificity L-threonine aldolase [Parendozoicomonas haliclonae]